MKDKYCKELGLFIKNMMKPIKPWLDGREETYEVSKTS